MRYVRHPEPQNGVRRPEASEEMKVICRMITRSVIRRLLCHIDRSLKVATAYNSDGPGFTSKFFKREVKVSNALTGSQLPSAQKNPRASVGRLG